MIASASVDLTCRTVKKCSSGHPLTIQRQQIDSSYCVLISWHSSANIEKNGLDIRLVSNFLSSHVSMASISIVTLNLEVN